MDKADPQFITKFVEEKYFEDTKAGRIKFGTLKEYREYEGDVEARLGDSQEGICTEVVRGPIVNKTFKFGIIDARNITIDPRTTPVRSTLTYNAFIFCATTGNYDQQVHINIQSKNPTLTHYVVFDLMRFQKPIFNLFNHCPFKVEIYGGNVFYQPPEIFYDARNLSSDIDPSRDMGKALERQEMALFAKSPRFSYEKEYRICAVPGWEKAKIIKPVFTKGFSKDIQNEFASAVIGSGSLKL
ncbi:MAG: hypothetical protein COA85_12240 [Robiginitomaculum sp.]|nr:MAG: hypothetical protein COA85_12240 [Robiginitomaculum sp.]